MDVLKRWARLVKGLQIRRRLQAQYQRADTGGEPHGGIRNADIKRSPMSKQKIIVQAPSAGLEPDPALQDSHNVEASEAGESDANVRYPWASLHRSLC